MQQATERCLLLHTCVEQFLSCSWLPNFRPCCCCSRTHTHQNTNTLVNSLNEICNNKRSTLSTIHVAQAHGSVIKRKPRQVGKRGAIEGLGFRVWGLGFRV